MPDSDAPAPTPVELDDDGKRLQLQAEKAKYQESIAKSAQAVAAARTSVLAPDLADAPKGEVTVGEHGGAFGPWLAHGGLQEAAASIAASVRAAVGNGQSRVLVVEDRSLLPADWAGREVQRRLDAMRTRIDPLVDLAATALQDFEDAARASVSGPREVTPAMPTDEAAAEGEEAAPAAAPAAAASPLAAAVDLLGLLRTDYALTAAGITTSPSELPTLVAGALANAGVPVELDGFVSVPDAGSPLLVALDGLRVSREQTALALLHLDRRIAPFGSALAALKGRIERLEQAWAAALVAKEAPKAGVDALRAELEVLVERRDSLETAHAPASAVAAHVRTVLAEADAAIGALVQAPAGAVPPLVTALARERFHVDAAEGRITHFLYVHVDEARSDVVTRRSIVGTSSQLGFLAGVSTSWVLLDADGRTVKSGGAPAPAGRMVFDLDGGSAVLGYVPIAAELPGDRLRMLEAWARVFVVAVVLALVVMSGLGLWLVAAGVLD